MPYDVDIGDGADALGQNQLTDALDGTYWVSGWDATLGTGDLEVDIAAGSGAVDGTDVSTGSTQTIDFTGDPDSTDPHKAVIYVDATGTVQKALGTPQPVDPSGEIRFRTYNPSPPASVSGVVVAEVWLAAGETVLKSADVRDRRVANQAATAATPNTPGWVEDDNSPFTATNTASEQFTLAGDYNRVLLYPTNESVGHDQIRVNGDSGTNYLAIDNSDTNTSGQTEWPLGTNLSGFDSLELVASPRNGRVALNTEPAISSTGVTVYGLNLSDTLPIDTFTVLDSGGDPQSITLRAYGLSL